VKTERFKVFQDLECWKIYPTGVHKTGSRFWILVFISLLRESSEQIYFSLSILSVIQITTPQIYLLCCHIQNNIFSRSPAESLFENLLFSMGKVFQSCKIGWKWKEYNHLCNLSHLLWAKWDIKRNMQYRIYI